MSVESIVNNWLNSVKSDLTANYLRLGLKASGNWPKKLEPFQKQSGGNIKAGMYGAKYTGAIEIGRKKNKVQSEEAIKKWVGWAGSTFLKQWVDDKNVDISPYAVAYKIAREGWKVPNRFNAGGLVSDVLTRQKIDELNKQLALFTIDEIRSDILNNIQDASN